jgi:predicted NAD-dependent protein-ADP-ribosyltransferase YbiA (DUF1768 family)
MEVIGFFDKDKPYFEFSNYFAAKQEVDGIVYETNEKYYQSQKFNQPDMNSEIYFKLLLEADSPQKVKDMANQKTNYRGGKWFINKAKPELGLMNDVIKTYKSLVTIRPDWEDVKDDIMRKGLCAKFSQNPALKKLLISTKGATLEEASPYDSYWGTAKNGKNMLGNLLMELRDSL